MRTAELIDFLACGVEPVPRGSAAGAFTGAAIGGVAAAAALAVVLLGPIPPQLLGTQGMAVKLVYALALMLACGVLAAQLGRPGRVSRRGARAAALVVALMLAAGIAALARTPEAERASSLFAISWLRCAPAIALFSLPAFAGAVLALRRLAPTRLRMAGFAAGMLAGAAGAAGYAFACPEQSVAFIAVWYTAGIAVSAALGALAGPRLLRW